MGIKHSFEELVAILRQYYPPIPAVFPGPEREIPTYGKTEERRRLGAARIHAGTEDGAWQAMLDRLQARLPGGIENRKAQLKSGDWDSTYTGILNLPSEPPIAHTRTFMVSFLAPYYIIYGERWVSRPLDLTALDAKDFDEEHDDNEDAVEPIEFRFDLTPEEAPHAAVIAAEIEATFGAQRMPPEIGFRPVPTLAYDGFALEDTPLFRFLFANIVPRTPNK